MDKVHCLHPWDEKKALQFKSWVQADDQRYALFLEEDPAKVALQTPHPRIRCIFVPQDFSDTLEQVAWEFLYLPFSFESPENPLLQKLAEIQSKVHLRALDFNDQGLGLLANIKYHLSHPISTVKNLSGAFKGLPAVVCGGGPSLTAARPHLKRLEDSALLIGCGAGVEALAQMNIRPHFAAHVDPDPLHTFKASDIPLLYQLRSSKATCARYTGPHLLAAGAGNFPLESWIQEKLGLEPSFDGGWTVGTFGVAMAVYLGCNPIILAGMDLAGRIYAPGVREAAADQFLPVKNRLGENAVSRPDWILAAKWLEQFAKLHHSIQWGTVAERGLDIPSIPYSSLEGVIGSQGVSKRVLEALPLCQEQALWSEISNSFIRAGDLSRSLLEEIQQIFPQDPLESGRCALLEHDLSEELAYQAVLSPVWTHWQHPIRLHNSDGERGLFLNRVLLFQALCEKINAL